MLASWCFLGAASTALAQLGTAHGDSAAVAALLRDWEGAWNAHDMTRFAALFTEDANMVTVGAGHLVGRRAIEADHAPKHVTRFRESVLRNEPPSVRFLTPDIALVHLRWAMRGDRNADGSAREPRSGLLSCVVMRTPDGWRVRAAHNTNATTTPATPAPHQQR